MGRSGVYRVEVPGSRHALQLVFTSVYEPDTGSGDQVDHGPRHENLRAICQRGDARADVDSDASDVVPDAHDLSGVQPDANVDTETMKPVANRQPALDRSCRAVEEREKPVASRVDLPSSEVLQLPTNGVVMHRQELVPPPIAEFSRRSGRPNDVSEEHGRQHTVEHGTWPAASDELLYLVQDLLRSTREEKMIVSFQLDEL